jgi:hypothetical protein
MSSSNRSFQCGGRESHDEDSTERKTRNPYYCSSLSVPPLETVDDFVRAIVSEDDMLIRFCLWEARQRQPMLLSLFEALANVPRPSAACREAFLSAWVTQGLWIRENFSVDPLLPAMLANLLPGYAGPPMELFRGERGSNHRDRTYGPSWTSKRSTAEMFASGLNRCPQTGGVLLRSTITSSGILAEPTAHSRYLGEWEYIVDRRSLEQVDVLETF